ncbi:TIGR03621 family F420-dependent LLM class oxidoreductase [Mycobacterium interjectum]|uniref:TIGR03621 family F420-dependent LLM class oxidoreductase n=1 Tax=Mycobacterium interjectum TaxID=33895 RepID=UPI0008328B28|nr:TIGR03621 family F420-dependent LLM class oxidoreductase [Mycobacterium interjectum]MCV7089011.1 TIGR03621 family F420-dependent LLM class oxidoreductase [Mycobacterium interjectum]
MTGRSKRAIRFGLIASGGSADALVETAISAERHGFSSIALNDHLNSTVAPLLGLQAMAAATSDIRIATAVLNQDLRHPAVLAKELATLDVLSGGRLELGLGAGWVRADYDQSGIPFRSAGERIERLEENVDILRRLFSDGPCNFAGRHYSVTGLDGTPKPTQPGGPPIMIGGGGRKILSMAARRADVVQVLGASFGTKGAIVDDLSSFRVEAFEQRVEWLAAAAGDRFREIELSLMLVFVAITDDVEKTAKEFLNFLTTTVSRYGGEVGDVDVKLQTLLDSPVVAIGTLDEVCRKLTRVRDELGFNYFVVPYGSAPQSLAPIVGRLAGT